jgi:hypothetical protein
MYFLNIVFSLCPILGYTNGNMVSGQRFLRIIGLVCVLGYSDFLTFFGKLICVLDQKNNSEEYFRKGNFLFLSGFFLNWGFVF